MYTQLNLLYINLEKKKEATDKVKHLAVETLGLAFVSYGSDLPEDSPYGKKYQTFDLVESNGCI